MFPGLLLLLLWKLWLLVLFRSSPRHYLVGPGACYWEARISREQQKPENSMFEPYTPPKERRHSCMQIDSPRHVQSLLHPPVFAWPPCPGPQIEK